MALELKTPTLYGADALYWRVKSVDIRRDQGTASWHLDGYVSQANSTGLPVASRVFNVMLADVAGGPNAAMLGNAWAALGTLIYALSKSIPAAGADEVEFSAALDV
jgi:hypothetical protein